MKKAKERKKGFVVIRKPAEDEGSEETFVWMFDNHEATAINLCLKSIAFRRDPDLNWGLEENAALAHAYADFLKSVGVWSP